MHVLQSLPEEVMPTPGAITPPDRQERVNAVNVLAAVPMPQPRDLMRKAKKLQSFFSDKSSRVARHKLMQSLPPEEVIRIHSESVEGATIIQAINQSLDFKVLLYLRLGIPIASADANCSLCASVQLTNRHLVNGWQHRNYKHRKHKAIMAQISTMCATAGTLVAEKQHQCFNARTANKMDLMFSVDSRK